MVQGGLHDQWAGGKTCVIGIIRKVCGSRWIT